MRFAHRGIRLAGPAGFEPTGDGVKVRCLTAWRRLNIYKIVVQRTCTVVRILMHTGIAPVSISMRPHFY